MIMKDNKIHSEISCSNWLPSVSRYLFHQSNENRIKQEESVIFLSLENLEPHPMPHAFTVLTHSMNLRLRFVTETRLDEAAYYLPTCHHFQTGSFKSEPRHCLFCMIYCLPTILKFWYLYIVKEVDLCMCI